MELTGKELTALADAIRNSRRVNSALDATLIARLWKDLSKAETENLCNAGDDYALKCRKQKRNPFKGGYSLYITLEEPEDMDSEDLEEAAENAFEAGCPDLAAAIAETFELEEEVFRAAVRSGCCDYVSEHADDIEINDQGGYSSYLSETDDPDMIECLTDAGALPDIEDYVDYPFAMESVNFTILNFDDDFLQDVLKRFEKASGLSEEELASAIEEEEEPELPEALDNIGFEDIVTVLGLEAEDGELTSEGMCYGDEAGWTIIELLEALGYKVEFIGCNSRFEKTGVFYVEDYEESGMKISGMKWGYDGGGVACGPVPGNDIVELTLQAENGTVYVVGSRMMEFEKIQVMTVPCFDLLMAMPEGGDEWKAAMEKVQEHVLEDYDYELCDMPEEIDDSAYKQAVRLVQYALQARSENEYDDEEAAAADFLREYLGKDLSELDLSAPEYDDGYDDEEDQEEDEY